jgi:hypothetical protein
MSASRALRTSAVGLVVHVGSGIFGRVFASSVIRAYQRSPFL